MTLDAIFRVTNLLALCGWALLLLPLPAPRREWIIRSVSGTVIPLLLATAYAVLIAANWAGHQGGFKTLADVMLLFTQPVLVLAGWIHYLAFDLLTGSWEALVALRLGIRWWWLVPCLLLTFLFGPVGWLLFFMVRAAHLRRMPALTDAC